MNITVFDRVSYKISSRKITDEGFLRVPGFAARTGVQDYLACELGLDGDPNRIVKVYRPANEVFSSDSLDSYISADVTIEHPKDFVNKDNYSALSKGSVISAVKDGDFVKVDLVIKSTDAIEAVNSGKTELSAGYSAEYHKAKDSDPYDYIQKNIRVNHVALVDTARAGRQAKLFDNKKTSGVNLMKNIVLDSGRSVVIDDESKFALISDSIDRMKTKISDYEKDNQKLQATCDSLTEKVAKLEEENKKLNDSSYVSNLVGEIFKVKDSAIRIAGKDFDTESCDSMEIKRECLATVRKSIDWKQKSDDYVNAAFDFADEEAKAKEEEATDEDMEEKQKDEDMEEKKSSDSSRRFSKLAKDGVKTKKTIDRAGKRVFIDSNMWKVASGQMTMAELEAKAKDIYGG